MMATELQVGVRKVVSVNPATGESLREFECFSEGQVQSAVARARAAQVAWAQPTADLIGPPPAVAARGHPPKQSLVPP